MAAFMAALCLCFSFACGDGNNPEPTLSPEFSCLINGVPFTGSSFNNTLFVGQNQLSGDFSKRFDIRATSAGGDTMLTLTFGEEPTADTSFNCLPLNVPIVQDTNFVSTRPTSAFMTLTVGNLSDGFPFDGQVTLTACDETDGVIDGTFSLRATSLVDSTVFEYTNGVFRDMELQIIK